MKKITTTREYNSMGNMIKEVVIEENDNILATPLYPVYPTYPTYPVYTTTTCPSTNDTKTYVVKV